MDSQLLDRLAGLLHQRHRIDLDIATIIGRTPERGHIGEFIAAVVFDIQLNQSASQRGFDGHFRSGPRATRRVNIKFYGRCEYLLDLSLSGTPDDYLVLVGSSPKAPGSSIQTRPRLIDAVYLFDAAKLHCALQAKNLKLGTAASVAKPLWEPSKIWPGVVSEMVSDQQAEMLNRFGPPFIPSPPVPDRHSPQSPAGS
jgi:hypothetical protein